jgi:hypothetical protein
MRSSQLNFFLTRSDQAELLRKLDPLGSFVYVEDLSQDGSPQMLESGEIRQMGAERLKIFITLSPHSNRIVFKQATNVAYVDELRSPVVAFSRCYQDDQRIGRGRFYFVKSYFDERVVVDKDEDFLKWGTSLISRARRMLARDPKSFAYFGPEALRLKDEGVKMELG